MAKKYYIKERHNPQTGIYYVAEGKLSKKEANKKEYSLYGTNIMQEFEDEGEYTSRIDHLKSKGFRVY